MNYRTKVTADVDGSSFLSFAESAKTFYANINEEGKSELINIDNKVNTQDTTPNTNDKTNSSTAEYKNNWQYYMHYYYINLIENIENRTTKVRTLCIYNEFIQNNIYSTTNKDLYAVLSVIKQTNPVDFFISDPLIITDNICIEALYKNSNIIYMNKPSVANQTSNCAIMLKEDVNVPNDLYYKIEIRRIFYEADLITLKPELWYLMSMMPELLFYIEWRLTKSLRNVVTKFPVNIQKELNIMDLIVRNVIKEKKPSITIDDDFYRNIKTLRFLILKNLKFLDCQPVRSSLYKCGYDYFYDHDPKKIEYECFIKVLLIYPFTLKHDLDAYETNMILEKTNAHNIEIINPSQFVGQLIHPKSNRLDIIFNLMLVIDYVSLIKGISVYNNYKILLIMPYRNCNIVIRREKQPGNISVCIINNTETLGLLFDRLQVLMQIDVNQIIEK